MAAGHGGQVLLSEAAVRALGDPPPAEFTLRELGVHHLRGLSPETLFQAVAPDLDSRFERLYGYLHDDVTRRRASIGLALELAGLPHGRRDRRSCPRSGSAGPRAGRLAS